ncbi:MAG TPA: ferredoxin [Candidatus Latescibacteria bacterium]|nr:ferredoxin [Candidatus Latescibacterota bacterium]
MAITSVWVNEEDCTACGLCEETCPEVFEVGEVAHVKDGVDLNIYETEIKEAADGCPAEAIGYEEE